MLLGACSEKNEEGQSKIDAEPLTVEQKISYALGYSLASQIESAGMDVDAEAVSIAVSDVRNKNELALTAKQMQVAGSMFQNLSREKQLADTRQTNIEEGHRFLAENAKSDNVETSPKGVQYKVIVPGDGKSLESDAYYTVRYKGQLLDGTVFESSDGESVSFYLDQVIPGWSDVLPLMTKGATWKIWVPHHLAYPNGTKSIPAGSTLVFDIELVDTE